MSEPRITEGGITVNVIGRLRGLMLNGEIAHGDELTYSYNGGYEILTHKVEGGGSSEYRGVYHPNVVCEGGGVCKWCGRVIW